MKKISGISYKKIAVYAIIFLLIISHSICSYGAYSVNISLAKFVSDYKVSSLSKAEIDQKKDAIKLDAQTKKNANSDIGKIESHLNLLPAEEKIKYLDGEFKSIITTSFSDINTEEDFKKYAQPVYEYIGYSLGYLRCDARKESKQEQEIEGKSQEELRADFDKIMKSALAYIKNNKDTKNVSTYVSDMKKFYTQLENIKEKLDDKKYRQKDMDTVWTALNEAESKQEKEERDKLNDQQKKEQLEQYKEKLGESTASADHNVDEVIDEANSFISKGENAKTGFKQDNLKTGSNTLFNILLVLGIAGTVIAGIYLGIKFMLSSAEDKAKVKESLVPYFAGCIVIYGAFTIWKVVIVILQGL